MRVALALAALNADNQQSTIDPARQHRGDRASLALSLRVRAAVELTRLGPLQRAQSRVAFGPPSPSPSPSPFPTTTASTTMYGSPFCGATWACPIPPTTASTPAKRPLPLSKAGASPSASPRSPAPPSPLAARSPNTPAFARRASSSPLKRGTVHKRERARARAPPRPPSPTFTNPRSSHRSPSPAPGLPTDLFAPFLTRPSPPERGREIRGLGLVLGLPSPNHNRRRPAPVPPEPEPEPEPARVPRARAPLEAPAPAHPPPLKRRRLLPELSPDADADAFRLSLPSPALSLSGLGLAEQSACGAPTVLQGAWPPAVLMRRLAAGGEDCGEPEPEPDLDLDLELACEEERDSSEARVGMPGPGPSSRIIAPLPRARAGFARSWTGPRKAVGVGALGLVLEPDEEGEEEGEEGEEEDV
ncbi:hypothetical protein CALCODRAFT_484200 [Calocera cornea HHB12733]|uniref:Uncharacterized protein n=1 Tax=Calocera cornea HHB12733 TaxID=1353952 RepID=A0A165F4P5_9BASI|nr:hypothetical protein CALCODRAFT_484200 [Calocera cornea HHB12733]